MHLLALEVEILSFLQRFYEPSIFLCYEDVVCLDNNHDWLKGILL